MYSQCPQCRTIFKVSERDTRAHKGLVRCGHCNAIFHAVTNEVSGLKMPGESSGEKESPESRKEAPGPAAEQTAPSSETGDLFQDQEPDPAPELAGGDGDSEWVEPKLPDIDAGDNLPDMDDSGFPGGVTEEIVIEAPPVLRNAFDDDLDEQTFADDTEPQARSSLAQDHEDGSEPRVRSTRSRADAERPWEAEGESRRRTPRKSPYQGKDIKLVELPQPKPFKTASLSLLAVFLILLFVWQVKTFFLDDLAQIPIMRPYLERICRPLGCTLPPRLDFAQIDLVGTSISLNPERPGALEIKASLMNRAHFPQPYPLLRVTLTDREGRVVGRRTYLPSDYQVGDGGRLLPIKETHDVSIDLAQPPENAVGYEVELVSPDQANTK